MRKDLINKLQEFKDNLDILVDRFSSPGFITYYEEMNQIPKDKYLELSPGCFAKKEIGINENLWLRCKLIDCSVQKHKHPNYSERFTILSGSAQDKVSGRTLREGDVYTFDAGVWHHIEVSGTCEILVECIIENNIKNQ